MKFSLLISIILICNLPMQAQDEMLNQVDNRGQKMGQWQGYYEDGKVRYTGQFRNDRPYGTFNYYYPSGKLRATNTFSVNGRVAHNKTFFEDGKIMAQGKYVAQKKDSTWCYYSDISGTLISEEEYTNDLLHGSLRNYFPENGQLSETCQ
jgi:antitoxin component YwqK of YwqJK toxin-antitoxin module